jgi:transcriptional regulator with XRE-family HTH domain
MISLVFDPHHLRHLRTKRNISQEKLAEEIGVSRPTYLQVEKGERELTVTEAQKLAGIFGMSLEDFLGGQEHQVSLPELPAKKKAVWGKTDMRINAPQEKMDKFREVLLYILQKIGAKPNVGETVIYKILYFIDFDFYEKFEEQLIGLKYIKNHHGPSPVGFTQMVAKMEGDKDLVRVKSKYFQYDQKKYMPLRESDFSKIDSRELHHIDAEIARLSDMDAAQIREYSHEDMPWKVHKMGEQLDYEYVFYREPPYSVRSYDTDPL